MLSWQGFRGVDVGLPTGLLPADWPRAGARRLFAERYDALGPGAEERMRGHMSRDLSRVRRPRDVSISRLTRQ